MLKISLEIDISFGNIRETRMGQVAQLHDRLMRRRRRMMMMMMMMFGNIH
jgi:hypothetical protein